jgi:periplasmic divalent cation tolerance protein
MALCQIITFQTFFMKQNLVVLSTCSNEEEAHRIGSALVEQHLAACVQVLPPMRSIYRWQGKIETAAEHLLVIKSNSAKFQLLQEAISRLHSYDVPEILALPVTAGSEKYLAWMEAELE